MKRSSLLIAGILSTLAASTFAEGLVQGVTESTDPAKVAAVEQHAAALQAQQSKPMPTHHPMRHHGKMHHEKMHAMEKTSAK